MGRGKGKGKSKGVRELVRPEDKSKGKKLKAEVRRD